MLKIRLQRVGRKHDPSFRIVLTDSKNGPRSGNFLEILGHYDPKKDIRKVYGDRIKELVAQGAQTSDTVHNILVSEKVIEGKKINVLPKKSPIVSEKTEEEVKKDVSTETTEETKEDSETPVEETKDEVVEEATEEKTEEASATEEVKEETPAEEKKEEAPVEEVKEEKTEETKKEE